ncbi:hypothetical protein BjapCC829_07615 [Bradyrhizobium barranii]|uniref:Uncharacterized protein n=1 Tax=Bradyrhizobium barranii TaxID=2992140 RepID=A0ABY3QQV8_9BRAD|nr:hypothetical protein [Bradyrhizobium japonicum]UFW88399.1 hypothetical protein BjapCC829_07615 [Bradyrhizobium japonicum]
MDGRKWIVAKLDLCKAIWDISPIFGRRLLPRFGSCGVPRHDVHACGLSLHRFFESGDRAEHASFQGALGQQGEEAFDLIDPWYPSGESFNYPQAIESFGVFPILKT